MDASLESLLRTVEQLGDGTGEVTEKDELRVAEDLAEHLTPETAGCLLVLLRTENIHARIVALQAVSLGAHWSNAELLAAVIERLEDPIGRVRAHAAWVLGRSGVAAPAVTSALRRLAGGASHHETLDLGDADRLARVQAARALKKLRTPKGADSD